MEFPNLTRNLILGAFIGGLITLLIHLTGFYLMLYSFPTVLEPLGHELIPFDSPIAVLWVSFAQSFIGIVLGFVISLALQITQLLPARCLLLVPGVLAIFVFAPLISPFLSELYKNQTDSEGFPNSMLNAQLAMPGLCGGITLILLGIFIHKEKHQTD